MKTNEEYIDNSTHCPKCDEDTAEGIGGFDVEYDIILQSVKCTSCDFSWTDIYKLIGFEKEE